MSSTFFDAGDFQRLDRERTLIEQSERVPIEPDRTPPDEIDEPTPAVALIKALADLLSERK